MLSQTRVHSLHTSYSGPRCLEAKPLPRGDAVPLACRLRRMHPLRNISALLSTCLAVIRRRALVMMLHRIL